MFSQPVLTLDVPGLEGYLKEIKLEKQELLNKASADKELIMSNDKFATALMALDVKPPKKISLRTGKEAWEIAKSDQTL